MSTQRILVTGRAGFIGSALVRHLIAHSDHQVMVIDALTYAESLDPLSVILDHPRLSFRRIDIREAAARWMLRTSSSRLTWSAPTRC